MRISLKKAVEFHGHIGPYLVLGLLMGDLAIKELGCGRHFGLEVRVYGADKKPKSCLIDGLQLSTGATYGKGNIKKCAGRNTKAEFISLRNNKKIVLSLKPGLTRELSALKTHSEFEAFAGRLCRSKGAELFNLIICSDS